MKICWYDVRDFIWAKNYSKVMLAFSDIICNNFGIHDIMLPIRILIIGLKYEQENWYTDQLISIDMNENKYLTIKNIIVVIINL